MIRYKVIGSGAFGTAFQDPDNPNKSDLKLNYLMIKRILKELKERYEAQMKQHRWEVHLWLMQLITFPLRKDRGGSSCYRFTKIF